MSMNTYQELRSIPGDKGWPLIGHTLDIIKDIQVFFDQKIKKHGEVFSTQFLGEEWIRLTGPDGCQFLLQDKEKQFSTRQGWESFVGDLFPRGLMLKDGAEHLHHRRIMQTAFNADAMESYQRLMANVIPTLLNLSDEQKPIEFSEYSRKLLLEIASLVFIGESEKSKVGELQHAFRNTVEATMAIIRKPIPGTKYNKGLLGRAFLEEYFLSKVDEKRQDTSGNLFSKLCQATDESGNTFSNQEVSDHMIFLMMAAQDTTTSALTSLLYALTEYPEWQEKLRHEYSHYDHLEFEDLKNLTLTSWTFKEALRMFTPGAVIPRRSLKEIHYKGYKIPAKTIVSVSPIHNHFLPEYWKEPQKFDPLRFSPTREEDKQHPYLFVPFSGGVHKCIGLHFAEMEIKMILFYLLKNYRVTRNTKRKIKWTKAPVWHPKNGLFVSFEKL